jgi:hypothetical protein
MCRFILAGLQRDHEGKGDTFQRGVDTGLEHADPQHCSQQEIGGSPHNAATVTSSRTPVDDSLS